ncbi:MULTISPECIES: hypothetical protein [Clostridium]|uniref:hypothetical protein n=1 Tax=Clostridium TaxID=1485 RepID=UPI001897BE6E|nr:MULTISPECIES: hypothetical protein [Clostridium]MDI9215849.1 hypothetical protein [Clostridium tertium]
MLKQLNKEKKLLRKKAGDDKLVISLVLIAIGVALCFIFRDKIQDILESAMSSLQTYVDGLFDETEKTSSLTMPIGMFLNLLRV